jgi:hypothetical protein
LLEAAIGIISLGRKAITVVIWRDIIVKSESQKHSLVKMNIS